MFGQLFPNHFTINQPGYVDDTAYSTCVTNYRQGVDQMLMIMANRRFNKYC